MDILLPSRARQRRIRRIAIAVGGALVLGLVTLGLSRLKPAPPSVERATVWIDTVKRGEMLRNVRGVGTLVPEEIRWIPAVTEGRVERLVLQAGIRVTPDSVILELSNPELTLAVQDAESQAKVGRAQLTELRVRLASQRLDQQAVLARVESQCNQARLKAEANEQLAVEGLVPAIDLKIARETAIETAEQLRIERERLASANEASASETGARVDPRALRAARQCGTSTFTGSVTRTCQNTSSPSLQTDSRWNRRTTYAGDGLSSFLSIVLVSTSDNSKASPGRTVVHILYCIWPKSYQ